MDIVKVIQKWEDNRVKDRLYAREVYNVTTPHQKFCEKPSLVVKEIIQNKSKNIVDVRVIAEIPYLDYHKIILLLQKKEKHRTIYREYYRRKNTDHNIKKYNTQPKMVTITIKKKLV